MGRRDFFQDCWLLMMKKPRGKALAAFMADKVSVRASERKPCVQMGSGEKKNQQPNVGLLAMAGIGIWAIWKLSESESLLRV